MSSATEAPSTPATVGGRWVRAVVLAVGSVLVFIPHFRPWEVGFLEEWPLSQLWVQDGPVAWIGVYAPWSISRPLHLVMTAIGLAVTGGQPGGIFLMLGLVAVGQFLLVFWALRRASRSIVVTTGIALFVALHPLWPAGYLQRFLPAQTSELVVIVAAGLLIRWLQNGRTRHIVLTGVATLVALLVYPAPAAAAPLLALALALAIPAPLRRRVTAVLIVTGVAIVVTVYSLGISHLVPTDGSSYEAGNLKIGEQGSPLDIVHYVGTTLLFQGATVLAGVLLVLVLGAILALSGAVPSSAGWVISGAALVSPACAIVFFGNIAWLQDIDRLGYTTSLGLIAALLVWAVTRTGTRPRLEAVIAVVLAVLSIVGAVRGVARWQPYIALQHKLMSELAPIVHDAHGREIVVVDDHSGTPGNIYTLPQGYVSSASFVLNHDPTTVWLCHDPSDPAASGSTTCATKDTGGHLRLVTTVAIGAGTADIYVGPGPRKASGQ